MIGIPSPRREDIVRVALGGVTWQAAVRILALAKGLDEVWLDDHSIDFILWERTAYPVSTIEHALRQAEEHLVRIAEFEAANLLDPHPG